MGLVMAKRAPALAFEAWPGPVHLLLPLLVRMSSSSSSYGGSSPPKQALTATTTATGRFGLSCVLMDDGSWQSRWWRARVSPDQGQGQTMAQ
ncbi:hypothetical protein BHM03_00013552 [Ensete ventricosum]|nr:hypothetical protein BHM03_00013552 [Ensete ventricosum]